MDDGGAAALGAEELFGAIEERNVDSCLAILGRVEFSAVNAVDGSRYGRTALTTATTRQ